MPAPGTGYFYKKKCPGAYDSFRLGGESGAGQSIDGVSQDF